MNRRELLRTGAMVSAACLVPAAAMALDPMPTLYTDGVRDDADNLQRLADWCVRHDTPMVIRGKTLLIGKSILAGRGWDYIDRNDFVDLSQLDSRSIIADCYLIVGKDRFPHLFN